MTRCSSLGSIVVGGKTVGTVQCCLDAGHDVAIGSLLTVDGLRLARERVANGQPYDATPHRAVLEWENDTVTPDLDLLDPDEELVDPLA